MDSFEISMTLAQGDIGPYWSMDLLVNGRSFLDQVRAFERPFANAEGHPDIAGDYAHVPAWRSALGSFADELLGKHGVWVALFECAGCGTPGCWPLMAEIVVEPERILWRRFEQPHRRGRYGQVPWDYTGLGIFAFERTSYEAEVQKVRDLAAQLPDMEEVLGELED